MKYLIVFKYSFDDKGNNCILLDYIDCEVKENCILFSDDGKIVMIVSISEIMYVRLINESDYELSN